MSIAGAAKTVVDSTYAYRFVRLMQKDFKEWKAFDTGIIDERGNVLRRPKTDEEKSAYTPFHAAIRSMKRTMSTVPGLVGIQSMMSAWSAIASRFGLTESDVQYIIQEIPLMEMVAGDAGGDATNIAKGETSGDVVQSSPDVMKDKPLKKRKRAIINQTVE